MTLTKSVAAITLYTTIFSSIAHADLTSSRLSSQELSRLPQSAQKFIEYNRHLIDDLGYAGIKAINFKKTNNNMSLTALIKDAKETKPSSSYSAVISGDAGSTNLVFRNYRDCTITAPRKLMERSIYIDRQKISTYYMCIKAHEGDNTNTEVFQIKTETGKKFAYNAFSNNTFTFVRFYDIEIPFDTSGFLEAWEESSKPAL